MNLWERVKRIFQPESQAPMLELIEAEREFLIWWSTEAEQGLSSEALVKYAVTRERLPSSVEGPAWLPADRADLNRCYAVYDHAPPHLQELMRPVMMRFEAAVEAKNHFRAERDRPSMAWYTTERRFYSPPTPTAVKDRAAGIADRMAKASRKAAEGHRDDR